MLKPLSKFMEDVRKVRGIQTVWNPDTDGRHFASCRQYTAIRRRGLKRVEFMVTVVPIVRIHPSLPRTLAAYIPVLPQI